MMRRTPVACCKNITQFVLKRNYTSHAKAHAFHPEGVYAPIITPFEKGTQKVAVTKLRENVGKLVATKLDGLVVLGSNGEFPLMNYQERLQVLEAVSKENKDKGHKKKLIAGTGAVSTQETIDLTCAAAELGYDAAMVVTPYYYISRMTSTVLRDHFTAVAVNSPIPIILYNVPPFTGITMSVDLVSELSKHKNIIGVKDTTGSIPQISETARRVNDNFVVLAGSAGYMLQALVSGAKGSVTALANVLPNETATLWALYKANKFQEAQELQRKLVVINDIVTLKFGVGGLKYACELMGYHGGDPRAPVPPVTDAQRQEIKAALQNVM